MTRLDLVLVRLLVFLLKAEEPDGFSDTDGLGRVSSEFCYNPFPSIWGGAELTIDLIGTEVPGYRIVDRRGTLESSRNQGRRMHG